MKQRVLSFLSVYFQLRTAGSTHRWSWDVAKNRKGMGDFLTVGNQGTALGYLLVHEARLNALYEEIEARDWDGTEFQYDRVRQSYSKMRDAEFARRKAALHG